VSTLRLNLGHAAERVRLQRSSRNETGTDRGGGRNRREVPKLNYTRLGSRQTLPGGVHGFQRMVRFAIDEDLAVIRERVRETLEAE
jgi:hypothetical protein